MPSLTTRLAQEHLEELSFLLLDRAGALERPDGIAQAAEVESRIEAHLDGLRFAGDPALEHLKESLGGSDLELVQGASYALASLEGVPGTLETAVAGLVAAKEEAIAAHRDALRHALHPELTERLVPLLAHPRAKVREATVEVLAYRREVEGRALVPLLDDADPGVRGAAARGLSSVGGGVERGALEAALLPGAGAAELVLLLRLGSTAALAACRSAGAMPEHLEALAIAGGSGDQRALAGALSRPELKAAAAQALGLHGHADSIPRLLDLLADPEEAVRVAAGRALEILSGAGLTESFEVPEEEEADGGDDAEAAGRSITVSRASTDPAAWRKWWSANQGAFQPGARVRAGRPFSLAHLIADLEAPGRDLAARRLALLELEIRAGQLFAFEPDDFGPRRARGLAAWRAWWKANETRFPPGLWTFGGAAVS